jgi:hypothetical protein
MKKSQRPIGFVKACDYTNRTDDHERCVSEWSPGKALTE